MANKLIQLKDGNDNVYPEIHSFTFQNSVNTTNVADEANVEVPVNVPKTGIYIVFFSVAHCGGTYITMDSPYWTISGNGIAYVREAINLSINKTWDNSNVIAICLQLTAGTYTVKFTNHTGVPTDNTYPSTFSVQGVSVQ